MVVEDLLPQQQLLPPRGICPSTGPLASQLAGVDKISIQFAGCELFPKKEQQLLQTNDLSLAHEELVAATGRLFQDRADCIARPLFTNDAWCRTTVPRPNANEQRHIENVKLKPCNGSLNSLFSAATTCRSRRLQNISGMLPARARTREGHSHASTPAKGNPRWLQGMLFGIKTNLSRNPQQE